MARLSVCLRWLQLTSEQNIWSLTRLFARWKTKPSCSPEMSRETTLSLFQVKQESGNTFLRLLISSDVYSGDYFYSYLIHTWVSSNTLAPQHPSYPGMPMVPRASDSETSWGQSGMMGMRSAPPHTVWVLQPQRPTTWLPTGNDGFLLWTTLQRKQNRRMSNLRHN